MSITDSQTVEQTHLSSDSLPLFAIGHVSIQATDVAELTNFYTSIGFRLVVNMGRMSIIELRGGTHIILKAGAGGSATLDFIVDDIDETHLVVSGAGATVTDIGRGNPHDSFVAADPEGNVLHIHSTHAIGKV